MYTLRRIDQNQNGIEKRSNNYLGKTYEVIYRVPTPVEGDKFLEICNSYFGLDEKREISESDEREIKSQFENITGFITDEYGKMYPFYKDQSSYIVSLDGNTIERVYGMTSKY